MSFFGKHFRVLKDLSNQNVRVYLEARSKKVALGFSVDGDINRIGKDKWKALLPSLTRIDECYGTLGIQYVNGDRYLVIVNDCRSVGKLTEQSEAFCISGVAFIPLFSKASNLTHNIEENIKFWQDGSFFFGIQFDLTRNLQRQQDDTPDDLFLWNRYLQRDFIVNKIADEFWLLSCMRGSVNIHNDYIQSDVVKVGLICRKACEMASLGDRGLNDFGYVANFVEVEQILTRNEEAVSFVQVRGSPYMFFKQSNPEQLSNISKVKFTRTEEATHVVFGRFLEKLKKRYGFVYFLNLLNPQSSNETLLLKYCESFCQQYETSNYSFDYYHKCEKMAKKEKDMAVEELLNSLSDEVYSVFHTMMVSNQQLATQKNILYTTCLNTSSRSHPVQFYVAFRVLSSMLEKLGLVKVKGRIESKINELWTVAGVELRRVQNIVEASPATQNKNKKSKFQTLKAIKLALNSSGPSNTINDTLGKTRTSTHVPDLLTNKVAPFMKEKEGVFTSVGQITIYATSWVSENLITNLPYDKMQAWLGINEHKGIDMYVISLLAFQGDKTRLVNLFANVVGPSYCPVHYDGENGTMAIFVFAAKPLVPEIRNVDFKFHKVGGVTSHAVGAGLRFELSKTSFFFGSVKFTGGKHSSQRESDYRDILKSIHFYEYGGSENHDIQLWMGNLQFRLNVSTDLALRLMQEADWAKLSGYDNLKSQMHLKKVFANFEEGAIDFSPTSPLLLDGNYDFGEKEKKIPLYSDRILFKGPISNSFYSCVPSIIGGTHFPITGVFVAGIEKENLEKKESEEKKIMKEQKYKLPAMPLSCTTSFLEAFVEQDSMSLPTLQGESSMKSLGRTNTLRMSGSVRKPVKGVRPKRPPPPKSTTLTVAEYQRRFVEKCTKIVQEHGTEHSGIYRLSGHSQTVAQLTNAVQHKRPYGDLSKVTLDCVSGALKLYFQRLSEPITTFELFNNFISAVALNVWDDKYNALRDTIEMLPTFNYYVLQMLMRHLNTMVQYEKETMMGVSNYAIVFSPSLFRAPDDIDPIKAMTMLPSQTQCVEMMIEHHDWLFAMDIEFDVNMVAPTVMGSLERLPKTESIGNPAELMKRGPDLFTGSSPDLLENYASSNNVADIKKEAVHGSSASFSALPVHTDENETGRETSGESQIEHGISQEQQDVHENDADLDQTGDNIFDDLDLSDESWNGVADNTRSPNLGLQSVKISQEKFDSILLPCQTSIRTVAQKVADLINAVETNRQNYKYVNHIAEIVLGTKGLNNVVVDSKPGLNNYISEVENEIDILQKVIRKLTATALELHANSTQDVRDKLKKLAVSLLGSLVSLHAYLIAGITE